MQSNSDRAYDLAYDKLEAAALRDARAHGMLAKALARVDLLSPGFAKPLPLVRLGPGGEFVRDYTPRVRP